MALINTVSMENAENTIKEGYEMFIKNIGIIPKPMEMMSASPPLFEIMLKRLEYYGRHPSLSFSLLAHIRYLVAHNLNYPFCTGFNKVILKKQGVEDEDIRKMEADPTQSLLEEKESAMLAFVVNAVKAPSSVTADEIENLRIMGWSDQDIVDALAQGVSMLDHAIMMEVFQMDQNCVID